MVNTLRNLLIALAVASPFLASFQLDVLGNDEAAVRSAMPSPFNVHREDDAGTRAEPSEEDDTEEEVVRDLQFCGISVAAHDDATPRVVASRRHLVPARCSGCCPPFSRGPPAGL